MELKPYLQSLARVAREALAAKCGTSLGHLTNISYGNKTCSPALAALLELHTGGAVMRWDMRPDDWHVIWRELIGWDGAPPVVVRSASQSEAA